MGKFGKSGDMQRMNLIRYKCGVGSVSEIRLQHIYLERWELLPEGKGRYLAIRRDERYGRDAILIVCGNHFNFVMVSSVPALRCLLAECVGQDRPTKMPFDPERQSHASLQEGNREEVPTQLSAPLPGLTHPRRPQAMKYLSLEGCHGRVSGCAPSFIRRKF
eukprot:767922-Hanusia_phi.AAC.5